MDREQTPRIQPDRELYADLDIGPYQARGWIAAAASLLLCRGSAEVVSIVALLVLGFASTRIDAELTTTGLYALLGLSVLTVAFATIAVFLLGRQNAKVEAERSDVSDEPGDEPGCSGEARQDG